jgi:hypothetical protein
MPDWKNLEVVERLMAALVASNDCKVSLLVTPPMPSLTLHRAGRLPSRSSPLQRLLRYRGEEIPYLQKGRLRSH